MVDPAYSYKEKAVVDAKTIREEKGSVLEFKNILAFFQTGVWLSNDTEASTN